ncbi:hypothetical protein GCM10027598_84760 [Amycolatopsis oliviviridis]|uniref:Bulb-type lectin domain-containing protein n=1 Tax=Amycolatopsis oliviviridis TaxID=1471590 RepID=A0ABQ3L9V6_9PSEU|nr:hypothetical protein [Amycolatopsis oliviviridis]GHH07659.1 hypothetical protein GCM10017790_14650 [Amycolatopsis oliviviridis]
MFSAVPSSTFQVWWRALGSTEWTPGHELLVHIGDGENAALEELSWGAADGSSCAVGFSPGMAECRGHRRTGGGDVLEIRGELSGEPVNSPDSGAARHHAFDTEIEDATGRRPSEPLRLLIDDGSGVAPSWLAWRDRTGDSCSIVLRSAGPAGNADVTRMVTEVWASAEYGEVGEVAANLIEEAPCKWFAPHDRASLEFQFSRPIAVDRYLLTSANDAPDRDPAAWVLRGSVDGHLWRTLDTRSHQSFTARHETRTYRIAGPAAYPCYRLDIVGNNGSLHLQLETVRFLTPVNGFTGYRRRAGHAPLAYRGSCAAPQAPDIPMDPLPDGLPDRRGKRLSRFPGTEVPTLFDRALPPLAEDGDVMTGGHRLRAGESLRRQSLTSLNDAFTLKHFGFDDLVLIRNHDRRPLWWSSEFSPGDWRRKTRGSGVSDVTLRPDGDLVAHDENGVPLRSTGTADRGVVLLEVRDDGDVVLLNGAGEIVWHTDTATTDVSRPPSPIARGDRMLVGQSLADQSLTSPNGRYVLVHDHQHAGTFLYGPRGRITRWFYLVPSMYPDPFGTRLVLEEDGLFLRWSKDEADGVDLRGVRKAWDSLTTPNFPFHPRQVVLRDSGDLEMLDSDGEVMWRNGYKRDSDKFAKSSNRRRPETNRKRAAAASGPPRLPATPNVPVIRTDFSDDDAWYRVKTGIGRGTPDGFEANVSYVDDPAFTGMTSTDLLESEVDRAEHAIMLVVDEITIHSPEHPILVVDLGSEPDPDDDWPGVPAGRSFRAVPQAIQEIENNLSLANADWEDFADHVDDDGVRRDT